jgi:hypothetical protein
LGLAILEPKFYLGTPTYSSNLPTYPATHLHSPPLLERQRASRACGEFGELGEHVEVGEVVELVESL